MPAHSSRVSAAGRAIARKAIRPVCAGASDIFLLISALWEGRVSIPDRHCSNVSRSFRSRFSSFVIRVISFQYIPQPGVRLAHPLGHGADEGTLVHASAYLGWICAAAPFVVFCFVPVNILRSEGKVREVFIGSVLGSVSNIILDPLMIFGLKLGAGGAALATFLAYLIKTLYFVWMMTHKAEIVVLQPSYLRLSSADLFEILRIGVPACVTNLAQSLAVMLTNRALTSYGSKSIAGYGIASKVLKSVLTAVTGVAAAAAADAVTAKVTGKKTNSKTSTGEKLVKRATKSATTTLTRELTRSILGNLVK